MYKKIIFSFLFILFAWGQLNINLDLEEDTFLIYDEIPIKISVHNTTNKTINFSSPDDNNIELIIIGPNGRIPSKGENHLSKTISFPPGITKEISFNLYDNYLLTKLGEYEVSLAVKHPLLNNQTLLSREKYFSIKEGKIEQSQNFGFFDQKKGKIFQRQYQILSYKKGFYTHLYLRVQDENWIYGQIHLGRKIEGVRFSSYIDALANIHILTQFKSREFYHIIISPEGKLRQKTSYKANTDSIPILRKNPNSGQVRVIGGVKNQFFD